MIRPNRLGTGARRPEELNGPPTKPLVMSAEPAHRSGPLPAVGIALVAGVSLLAAPLGTLGWAIAFDSTGLDAVVPAPLYTTLLPALSLALLPAGVAGALYDRRTALVVGVGVAAAAAAFTLSVCSTTQGVTVC